MVSQKFFVFSNNLNSWSYCSFSIGSFFLIKILSMEHHPYSQKFSHFIAVEWIFGVLCNLIDSFINLAMVKKSIQAIEQWSEGAQIWAHEYAPSSNMKCFFANILSIDVEQVPKIGKRLTFVWKRNRFKECDSTILISQDQMNHAFIRYSLGNHSNFPAIQNVDKATRE